MLEHLSLFRDGLDSWKKRKEVVFLVSSDNNYIHDRHEVINSHESITELKKRAGAWLSHLKRVERIELARRMKLCPMNKPWNTSDCRRFHQEHLVPLPSLPCAMPKTVRDLDDLAITMGMGRSQSAGFGNATLDPDPTGKSDTRSKHFHDPSIFMVEVHSTITISPLIRFDE